MSASRRAIVRYVCGAAAVVLVMGELPQRAVLAQPASWRAAFVKPTTIKSAGEYRADVTWNLESFSPVCLEPSATGQFTVARIAGNRNHLVFEDSRAPLRRNPAPPPFYVRGEGSISAIGWVAGEFENAQVTGEVNTAARAATSRQGLMARWDHGNNYYWFYVNFTAGTAAIMRSRFFGVMDDLPGSSVRIENFANTKSYYLELDLAGPTVRGRVFEGQGQGANRRMVADTNEIKDPEPQMKGVSGFLAEPSPERPFDPLRASFANLSSTAR